MAEHQHRATARNDGYSHSHTGHSHAAHGHSHGGHGLVAASESGRRLTIVLLLTGSFMFVEAAAGFWTNSLALLSDAGHMLTDVGALGLALFAVWFARRAAPPGLTFGYLRFEILAALINGVALLGITGLIFIEAWSRLWEPEPVQSAGMLAVAVMGLLINLTSLYVLSRGGGHSLNERGAILHVLGDALGSVGAIVAALVIRFTQWYAADAIVSAVIGLLILRSTWMLLKEAVNVLMEGAPVHLSFKEVHDAMTRVPGVVEVKDLHLWSLASGFDALSAHLVVPDVEHSDEVRSRMKVMLRDQFRIEHTTLEVERPGESDACPPGMEGRCYAWQRRTRQHHD
ncbi:MAG: cation diffusion facilitator family transporter [Armatimonadota bacterium]